jgi:hypothetical protein
MVYQGQAHVLLLSRIWHPPLIEKKAQTERRKTKKEIRTGAIITALDESGGGGGLEPTQTTTNYCTIMVDET